MNGSLSGQNSSSTCHPKPRSKKEESIKRSNKSCIPCCHHFPSLMSDTGFPIRSNAFCFSVGASVSSKSFHGKSCFYSKQHECAPRCHYVSFNATFFKELEELLCSIVIHSDSLHLIGCRADCISFQKPFIFDLVPVWANCTVCVSACAHRLICLLADSCVCSHDCVLFWATLKYHTYTGTHVL